MILFIFFFDLTKELQGDEINLFSEFILGSILLLILLKLIFKIFFFNDAHLFLGDKFLLVNELIETSLL